MTLQIFNPEHDIALASGLSNFTAPHAGRQLRHDLGFLPAIWSGDDDVIVVDDADYAANCWKQVVHRIVSCVETDGFDCRSKQFLAWKQLTSLKSLATNQSGVRIEPWGWNSALRALLLRSGVQESLLPSLQTLDVIRDLSHRRVASALLPQLRFEGTVGESVECLTAEETMDAIRRFDKVVLKAPWSSSGRGLRFCDALHLDSEGLTPHISGWLCNLLATQGSVMVEPYYNKVKDFGMEFESDGEGGVHYLGLSLFHTQNGAYTGNVLATEVTKETMLSRYVSISLLQEVRETICRQLGMAFCGKYRGPFGVDMMICAPSGLNDKGEKINDKSFLLHPCVEINLRRTMGHVALALSPHDDDILRVMRIEYNENTYKLKIMRT